MAHATYLTLPEIEQLVPVVIGNYNQTTFEPIVNLAFNSINARMPKSMQPIFEQQVFEVTEAYKLNRNLINNKEFQDLPIGTPLPELELFFNKYIKVWLALQVARDLQSLTAVTTTDGLRSYAETFTRETDNTNFNKASNYFEVETQKVSDRAFNEWQANYYVFDLVGWPPTINMAGYYTPFMALYNYGYWPAYGGWGWNNGPNGYVQQFYSPAQRTVKIDII